jgi:hypothetical protein
MPHPSLSVSVIFQKIHSVDPYAAIHAHARARAHTHTHTHVIVLCVCNCVGTMSRTVVCGVRVVFSLCTDASVD